MLSTCPHAITSSHFIKLSPCYHIISSSCHNAITSSNIIKLSPSYEIILSQQAFPSYHTMVSHQAVLIPIILLYLVVPILSHHSIPPKLCPSCYTIPPHHILSHQAVFIVTQDNISSSCPHPITLWLLITLSPSYHIIPSQHTIVACSPHFNTLSILLLIITIYMPCSPHFKILFNFPLKLYIYNCLQSVF